jgi:glycosyltransferase involved in cell wall biosynthesis
VPARDRIRVVHHVWRLTTTGGVPVVVRQLAGGLDPARFEQHVVSHRPLLEADDLGELPRVLTWHSVGIEGRPSPIDRARAPVRLHRALRTIRPDLVHSHSGIASQLLPWRVTDLARTATVLEVHDQSSSARVSATTDRLEAFAVRRLRFEPLVHSNAVAADVLRRTGRPVEPIPLGIDVSRFASPAVARREWRAARGIPEHAIVVLYVARLVASKNIPLFLDVAREVTSERPEVIFVLVGGGDVAGAHAQAAERGLGSERVAIVGFEEDLVSCFGAADVFLSTSSYEGFGIALVEAMASGLPVVSTRVGGTADVVAHGETGLLVDSSDARPLTDAVLELTDDPDRRARFGANGRRRAAERFGSERFVAEVAQLYERLVALAGGPS